MGLMEENDNEGYGPAVDIIRCDHCGCKCNRGEPYGDFDGARLYDNMYVCDSCFYDLTHNQQG